MTTTLAKKLPGVLFWGGAGLILLSSGGYTISHSATDSAAAFGGLGFMLMGGLGVIKALMIGTRS